MSVAMALLVLVHTLGATIWVGGMFFAYLVLRPVAGGLDPTVRLRLWRGVFQKFFPWVWASIATLLLSGYTMILVAGGFGAVGLHVHAMQLVGLVMMALYLHLVFAPWRRFRLAVDAGEIPEAGAQLGQIRRIVGINLTLGLLTIAIGASGRWWG
jgi:uncharacterized membrane protein